MPIGLVVAGANRPDFQLLRATLEALVARRPRPPRARPQGLCLDTGDDDREVYALLQEFRCAPRVRARGEEATAKRTRGARARRWVVERTHRGMNRCRALGAAFRPARAESSHVRRSARGCGRPAHPRRVFLP